MSRKKALKPHYRREQAHCELRKAAFVIVLPLPKSVSTLIFLRVCFRYLNKSRQKITVSMQNAVFGKGEKYPFVAEKGESYSAENNCGYN